MGKNDGKSLLKLDISPEYGNSDPVVDGLLGLAVGDAFGVPVEFMSRREVRALDLRDMVGCDTNPGFQGRWTELIPSGAWSDDTSMMIASMSSIIENKGKIDWEDIMRRFSDIFVDKARQNKCLETQKENVENGTGHRQTRRKRTSVEYQSEVSV